MDFDLLPSRRYPSNWVKIDSKYVEVRNSVFHVSMGPGHSTLSCTVTFTISKRVFRQTFNMLHPLYEDVITLLSVFHRELLLQSPSFYSIKSTIRSFQVLQGVTRKYIKLSTLNIYQFLHFIPQSFIIPGSFKTENF